MNREQWLERVGVLSFREYSPAEGELLEQLTVERVHAELRAPEVAFTHILPIDWSTDVGISALPASVRQVRQVQTYPSGAKLTELGPPIPQAPVEGWDQLLQVKDGAPRAWTYGGATAGGLINLVLLGGAILDASYQLSVQAWGIPADPWAGVAARFAPLYLWGGAVEGFQLQGDENGRERALRQFAVELDRANEHGEAFGWDFQGAPQDTVGWRT